jgi:light-regulated signal transduction histidine kinase (bacteriophytochrome)
MPAFFYLRYRINRYSMSLDHQNSDKKQKTIQQLDELLNTIQEMKTEAEKQKEKLNAVIDELESFSYSVSHDLRAPLRAITGFSGLLKNEYQDKLDDEGKRYIDIIQKGTQQMSNLIDELLNFSRVGRLELRLLVFDPTAIIMDVIKATALEYEKSFEVLVNHLDPIYGDAGTVKQIFSNLIRNAFKFSSKEDQPLIKIGSRNINNGVEFYVTDNGVGFDTRYSDKLFKVFQRLHTTNEFEGSGVGLAIVDRIVKKHEGKVWGDSFSEGGAGFYFWLPNKNNRP